MKTSKSRNGFTIVELLIVIVVIAILAAITIVAFNGVQTRAENAKTVNGINALVKTLAVYKVQKDIYPINASYPCVGQVGTACGVTTVTNGCWSIGYVGASSGFNDELKTVNSNIPEVSKQTMNCNTDGSKASGAFYYGPSPGNAYALYYFLKGDVDCGSPSGLTVTKQFSVNTTLCTGVVY